MGALSGLVELELGAAGDDLFAELDEALDEVAQRQRLRPAAAQRQHVGREGRLRRRVPPQLVEYDLRGRVALEIDDDTDAGPAGFVADVRNAFDALVFGGFGDFLDQARLADLEGDGGKDDRAPVAAPFLDVM